MDPPPVPFQLGRRLKRVDAMPVMPVILSHISCSIPADLAGSSAKSSVEYTAV